MYLWFEGPQDHFGISFGELFGYLGRHFGDSGGSLELVGILMYFRASPGEAHIESRRSVQG